MESPPDCGDPSKGAAIIPVEPPTIERLGRRVFGTGVAFAGPAQTNVVV